MNVLRDVHEFCLEVFFVNPSDEALEELISSKLISCLFPVYIRFLCEIPKVSAWRSNSYSV